MTLLLFDRRTYGPPEERAAQIEEFEPESADVSVNVAEQGSAFIKWLELDFDLERQTGRKRPLSPFQDVQLRALCVDLDEVGAVDSEFCEGCIDRRARDLQFPDHIGALRVGVSLS